MSLYLTVEEFRTEYSCFEGIEDDAVQVVIDKYEAIMNVDRWIVSAGLAITKVAIKLLVAHDLSVKSRDQLEIVGALAEINDRKMPKFQKPYEDYYELTPYGQQYLKLHNRYFNLVGVCLV